MSDQPSLFKDSGEASTKPSKLGMSLIQYKDASSILTKASGFMGGYDYTLNPYSGCAFGCTYCYASGFTRDKEKIENWGQWVEVKQNALDLIKRFNKPLEGKTVYMSSVTDPYQPVEGKLELTKSLLQELARKQPRLVIQTRSPLVKRDIHILKQFDVVQVNMTVTTDSESIRRAFEPACPGNDQRLESIGEIARAGIDSCITMTPLLPVEDAEKFCDKLIATGVRKFIVQPFHPKRGHFAAGTRDTAAPLIAKFEWDGEGYRRVREVLKRRLPNLGEGKEGFAPV